jgi:hypothetical protein
LAGVAEVPEGEVLDEDHSTPVLVAWPAAAAPFVVPLPPRTEVEAFGSDGAGGIWLAGVAPGSADFGSGPLRPEGGGMPTFVAHYPGQDASTAEMIAQATQVDELIPFGDGLLALFMTVEVERSVYGTSGHRQLSANGG